MSVAGRQCGAERTRGGRGARPLAAGLALLILSGCQGFENHRRELETLHAQGRYDAAAAVLDEAREQNVYGEKNRLLYWLDRGAIALAMGDQPGAIELLERAEAYMEVRRDPTTGDAIAQWLANDTAVPYYGEPYEDLYTNVLKLLAQLESGNVRGGATVEARRLAGKADVLRDRHVRLREAIRREGGGEFQRAASAAGPLVEANPEGEFVESTLGTYLTAVTFMKAGERDLQGVAGRRLLSSIELQQEVQPGVDPADFAGLGERDPASVNVLVAALSGRGPTKEAETIGPIPIFDWPLYFQLPRLVGGSQEAAGARVVVELEGGGVRAERLSYVEDMRAVAMENHRRELPLIYSRTLLRASLKAAASFAATQAVKASSSGDTRSAAHLGMVLAGLAFLALTEKADLRSWIFLPGRADVGLLDLPPGRHRVRVEYLSAGGGVLYAGPWHEVAIPAPGLSEADRPEEVLRTVVEHYWR